MAETKKNDGRKPEGKKPENKAENKIENKTENKSENKTENKSENKKTENRRSEGKRISAAKKPESRKPEKNGKGEGLVYKKHPLRRIGNLIYYGSMSDPFIILMQVKETRKEKNLDVATKVSIELQRTGPDVKGQSRIVKRSERETLYAAMDISTIWLERALAGK